MARAPRQVRVLGCLPPVPARSLMPVTPVLGAVVSAPGGGAAALDATALALDPGEVAAPFTFTLEYLARPASLSWHDIKARRDHMPLRVPAFRVPARLAATLPGVLEAERPRGAAEGECLVWGLTAYVLHQTLTRVLRLRLSADAGAASPNAG